MIKKRKYKYITIVIIIALLSQIAVVMYPKLKNEAADLSTTQQDQQIAADLSNLTGVAVTHIMELKNTGISWNKVSERLENSTPDTSNEDKLDRSTLLNETGVGEELMNQLRQLGFQDDEIMEAKLLTERIMLQLKEVLDGGTAIAADKPTAETLVNQTAAADNQAAYEKINDQFNEGLAVRLLLTLQQDFGSIEAVLNEYLLSLQMDLNLEDYITDKKTYQENKEQKTAGLNGNQMITVEKLEKAILDQLQQGNELSRGESKDVKSPTILVTENEEESPLPEIKPPSVEDIMPQNPGEAVRKEIEAIDPNHR